MVDKQSKIARSLSCSVFHFDFKRNLIRNRNQTWNFLVLRTCQWSISYFQTNREIIVNLSKEPRFTIDNEPLLCNRIYTLTDSFKNLERPMSLGVPRWLGKTLATWISCKKHQVKFTFFYYLQARKIKYIIKYHACYVISHHQKLSLIGYALTQ